MILCHIISGGGENFFAAATYYMYPPCVSNYNFIS